MSRKPPPRRARPSRDDGKPWYTDADAKAFLARAAHELPPMIDSSKIAISIVPDEADPKFAIELGYMIMLDKPIIIVVPPPGVALPEKLVRVADRIVQWNEDKAVLEAAMIEAMNDLAGLVDGQADVVEGDVVEEDSNG